MEESLPFAFGHSNKALSSESDLYHQSPQHVNLMYTAKMSLSLSQTLFPHEPCLALGRRTLGDPATSTTCVCSYLHP